MKRRAECEAQISSSAEFRNSRGRGRLAAGPSFYPQEVFTRQKVCPCKAAGKAVCSRMVLIAGVRRFCCPA